MAGFVRERKLDKVLVTDGYCRWFCCFQLEALGEIDCREESGRLKNQAMAKKDNQLIGKAKELHVASILVAHGLYVHFPLIDNGFDLIVSNRKGTKFIPIQVKYKESRSAFTLTKKDVERFKGKGVVLAFGSKGEGFGNSEYWFIPFSDWEAKAEDRNRQDRKLVVYFSSDPEWPELYKGEKGIANAFACLDPSKG